MRKDEITKTDTVRRQKFMAVIYRTYHYWPRSSWEPWANKQYDLLVAGYRGLEISDEAMGAWTRSDPSYKGQY
jgi:hypothetical protein